MLLPRIQSIATAVPPYRLDQDDVMRRAADLFDGKFDDLERLLPVFGNAAIESPVGGGRQSVKNSISASAVSPGLASGR